MMTINLLGHDHGDTPHLCVELTDEEYEKLQEIVDRARKIYGGDVDSLTKYAFKLLAKECDLRESKNNTERALYSTPKAIK